jgi:hypothetical protein
MIQMTAIIKKDDGSIMVAALLMLVLLTIIGVSATTMSNSELNITANAQLHKMAFLTAESGWHVMVGWLDDQYPLPTVNLGSDDSEGTDNTDNDGDGLTDENDEYVNFTTAQFALGSDGIDNDSDGVTDSDDDDEFYDMLPFSDSKSAFRYGTTLEYIGAGIAPGWDPTLFLRYNYQITSTARVPARQGNAVSRISITAGKIENVGS